MPTALQIAQGRQSAPLSQGLFFQMRTATPLLSRFDARTSTDDKFLTLEVVSLPTSSFVGINEGLTSSEGAFELREFSCSGIGGLVKAEVEASRLWNLRHPNSGFDWFGLQAFLRMKADLMNMERQVILGRANDPKGFPGAKEMTPFRSGNVLSITDSPQDSGFKKTVINAGGTTDNTASSVYSFVFGELEAQIVLGNDTGAEMLRVSEVVRQMMAPDSTQPNKQSLHDAAEVRGYIGLSVGGFNIQAAGQAVPTQFAVRRVTNLTGDTGKGLTDKIMDKLKRSHGEGRQPGLLAMSGRSGEQLAASRAPTAVNFNMGQSGDAQQATFTTHPAPPDNWNGIPIVYPDCITDADPLES